jgi:hypothetical protein
MLTDPNALAAKAAEHAYSAGNLVTCDGYYEFNLDAAQAAIAAVYAPRLAELEAEVERLRKENYRAFTDGMEAAAQICGSLAEVEYDDADGFDAATGCEAAIMRVVKDQRREQAALGASHD